VLLIIRFSVRIRVGLPEPVLALPGNLCLLLHDPGIWSFNGTRMLSVGQRHFSSIRSRMRYPARAGELTPRCRKY